MTNHDQTNQNEMRTTMKKTTMKKATKLRLGLAAVLTASVSVAGWGCIDETPNTPQDTRPDDDVGPGDSPDGGGPGDDQDAQGGDGDGCIEIGLSDVDAGGELTEPCYRAIEPLTVSQGTLTVAAGTRVEFVPGSGLVVVFDGRLSAVGTFDEPVVFTGVEPGEGTWAGITYQGTSSADNQLVDVEISGAGGSMFGANTGFEASIKVEGEQVRARLERVTVRDGAANALVALGDGEGLSVEDLTVVGENSRVRIGANMLRGFGSFNIPTDQTPGPIEVLGARLSRESSWPGRGEVAYEVTSTLTLGAPLTLGAGALVRFGQSAGLDVQGEGRLQAAGTSDAPVVFTGAEPTRGFWQGIRFENSFGSMNRLEHAVVEYAGGAAWTGAEDSRGGIFLDGEGAGVTLTDVTVRHNAFAGVHATDSDSRLSITGGMFADNESTARLHPEHVGMLADDIQTPAFEADEPIELVRGTLTRDASWAAHACGYRFTGTLTLREELSLAPGARLAFVPGTGLDVSQGRLLARGQAEAPVWFGAADGERIQGYWRGLRFGSARSSMVAWAEIESAGWPQGWDGADDSAASVFVTGQGRVGLEDVDIDYSANAAISLRDGGVLDPCTSILITESQGEALGDGFPTDLAGLSCTPR